MKKYIKKASYLIEALPYIRKFHNDVFVIKCGGAAMKSPMQMKLIMRDIALLHYCGIRIVVVHGGGLEISNMCKQLKITTKFVDGYRVTDSATMEIVQMVLIGKTNKELTTKLNQLDINAIGLSGHDANLIRAKKADFGEIDLGYVGNIIGINTEFLNLLLSKNFLPIIAPIGVSDDGQSYNVNADVVASTIASTLSARKLIFLSDVNGFFSDINNPDTRLSTIKKDTIKKWLQEKRITGGMLPKLQSCISALEHGVDCAHILDGTMRHSLLLEIFTDQGVGTAVTQ
jgi:acetylglutamate kinase